MTRHIDIALSYNGCGARLDKPRFCGVVCPGGPAAAATFLCTPNVKDDANSSCGVVARGFVAQALREAGRTELQGPLSFEWWTGHDWWHELVDLAKKCGAYRTGGMPTVGSIIHIVLGQSQHWRTLVRQHPYGVFDTIDGGGKDQQGYQLIHASTCRLAYRVDGQLWDEAAMPAKPVVDWIDVGVLLESLGVPRDASCQTRGGTQDGLVQMAAGGAAVKVIDVSGANKGKLDFGRMRAAGAIGGYARLQLGLDSGNERDTLVVSHTNGMRSAGMYLGLYLVLYPRVGGRVQDASLQAQQLVKAHREFGCTMVPMLDIEDGPPGPPTGRNWIDAIRLAVDDIFNELGVWPLLYSGSGFWMRPGHAELPAATDLTRCPLALADYGASVDAPIVAPRPVQPWDRVTLHQYAGGKVAPPALQGRIGHIDGSDAPIDLSLCYDFARLTVSGRV
jgi:hypothetical protein